MIRPRTSLVVVAFAAVLAARASVRAACPDACVSGGGPAATDCFLQFGGIASTSVTCTDGDPTCDTDGAVDGTCTIALTACVNVPGASCTSTGLSAVATVKPLKTDGAITLSQELAALSLTDPVCTQTPFKAPVKVAFTGLKPGVTKLAFTAASGGKKDKDKLVITCNPSTTAPSLATVIQPILTDNCATPGCHTSTRSGELDLRDGHTFAESVGKTAVSFFGKGLKVVEPGNVKKSYLARKIVRKGLKRGDSVMPQGCPGVVPCLTDAQIATILSWIQAGAPNN